MTLLFYILILFSEVFSVIITPSNIHENFSIDSVEGVGSIAIPEDFKITYRLKTQGHFTHGGNIQKDFCEYIISALQLSFKERESLYNLLNMETYDACLLLPFDHLLSVIRTQ